MDVPYDQQWFFGGLYSFKNIFFTIYNWIFQAIPQVSDIAISIRKFLKYLNMRQDLSRVVSAKMIFFQKQ